MKLDQKREKDQRSGLICAKRKLGAVEDFFNLGFTATGKTYSFWWPVYSSLCLVERLTFAWYCMWHEFGISWKPSDYSKCKRLILRVHHMKLHGELNASGFFFTQNRHIFKWIVNERKRLRLFSLRINWCHELRYAFVDFNEITRTPEDVIRLCISHTKYRILFHSLSFVFEEQNIS